MHRIGLFLGGGATHLVGSGWEFWMYSRGTTYENPWIKNKQVNKQTNLIRFLGFAFECLMATKG